MPMHMHDAPCPWLSAYGLWLWPFGSGTRVDRSDNRSPLNSATSSQNCCIFWRIALSIGLLSSMQLLLNEAMILTSTSSIASCTRSNSLLSAESLALFAAIVIVWLWLWLASRRTKSVRQVQGKGGERNLWVWDWNGLKQQVHWMSGCTKAALCEKANFHVGPVGRGHVGWASEVLHSSSQTAGSYCSCGGSGCPSSSSLLGIIQGDSVSDPTCSTSVLATSTSLPVAWKSWANWRFSIATMCNQTQSLAVRPWSTTWLLDPKISTWCSSMRARNRINRELVHSIFLCFSHIQETGVTKAPWYHGIMHINIQVLRQWQNQACIDAKRSARNSESSGSRRSTMLAGLWLASV